MTTNLQMTGNAALLDLPDKVAFLSSRRISAATAAACNRWIMAQDPLFLTRRIENEINHHVVFGGR